MSDTPSIPPPNSDFWLFGYGSLIWKPIPPLNNRPSYDARHPGYILSHRRRFYQGSTDHRGTPDFPGRVVTLIADDDWPALHPLQQGRLDGADATGGAAGHGEPTARREEGGEEGGGEKVYGVAYHIPAYAAVSVREYLDIREVGGYSVDYTRFHHSSSPSLLPSSTPPQPLPYSPPPPATASSTSPSTSTPASSSHPSPPTIENILLYTALPSNPHFTGPESEEQIARVIAVASGPSGRNVEYLFMLEKGLEELGGGEGAVDEHVRGLVRRVRGLVDGEREGEGVRVGQK